MSRSGKWILFALVAAVVLVAVVMIRLSMDVQSLGQSLGEKIFYQSSFEFSGRKGFVFVEVASGRDGARTLIFCRDSIIDSTCARVFEGVSIVGQEDSNPIIYTTGIVKKTSSWIAVREVPGMANIEEVRRSQANSVLLW